MKNEGDGTGCDRSYVYILPSDNGELTLKDSTDAEVLSGTTVKKGSELTVVTTPAEGYVAKAVSVNGAEITGNKFAVTKVTDVVARFELFTSTIDTKSVLATAEGSNREIRIACDEATDVTIVSLSGKLCHKTTIKGHAAIALPAGIYTVTMKQGSTQATKKLLVK